MKIRLMGSADLVNTWKAALENAYGITGATYPSRGGAGDARVYFDLDDRQAAAIVGLQSGTHDVATGAGPPRPLAARARRATRPRLPRD